MPDTKKDPRPMTDGEIVAEYKQAKSPMKQIAILADQNLCKKKDIVAILIEAGCDVPKQYLPKEMRPAPVKEPAEVVPEEVIQKEPRSSGNEMQRVKFAALDAIEKMLPDEECSGGEALAFIDRIRGMLQLIKALEV